MQNIHISHLSHMKGYGTFFIFLQKPWYQAFLVFIYWHLNYPPQNLIFWPMTEQKFYVIDFTFHYTETFRIVTNRHTDWFSIKTRFYGTNIFFISRTKQVYAKLLTFNKNIWNKGNVTLDTFFWILLTPVVLCKLLQEKEFIQYLQNYKPQDIY